jgi:hypothetical protein
MEVKKSHAAAISIQATFVSHEFFDSCTIYNFPVTE